jgi:hypothetical protein
MDQREVDRKALILIEVPPSAYRRGMLALGERLNNLKRRRPQAILQGAALGRVAMRA